MGQHQRADAGNLGVMGDEGGPREPVVPPIGPERTGFGVQGRTITMGMATLLSLSCLACDRPSGTDNPTSSGAAGARAMMVARSASTPESTALAMPGPAPTNQACVLPDDCVDIETSFFNYPACCRETTHCGYELVLDEEEFEESLMYFPQFEEFREEKSDDGCFPKSFFFPILPGFYAHRTAVEGGDDILITPDCESRGFVAFALPGCCMPNNQCGISTDEMADIFQVLLEGDSAPFTQPECVPAQVLNQQLRDSVKLAGIAHLPPTSGGPCDYAALDMQLPPE